VIHLLAVDTSALILVTASNILRCTVPQPSGNKQCTLELSGESVCHIDGACKTDVHVSIDPATSLVCVAQGQRAQLGLLNGYNPNGSTRMTWRMVEVESEIKSVVCAGDSVAVGQASGVIALYSDVLEFLKTERTPVESKLSWHQYPVLSLELTVNGTNLCDYAYIQDYIYSLEAVRRRLCFTRPDQVNDNSCQDSDQT
jgi:hypothetical protein